MSRHDLRVQSGKLQSKVVDMFGETGAVVSGIGQRFEI
jgi:hypothetical protein